MMILSNKTKIKIFLSIIVLAILVVSGFFAYFRFYVKTPSYAIKSTISAIHNHDIKEFSKYVDINSLSNSMAEPILNSVIESQGAVSSETKDMLNKMFLSPVVTSIKDGINQYVSYGNWDVKTEASDSAGAIIDPKNILDEIGLSDVVLVNMESVEEDGEDENIAYGKLIVKQESINKEFPLNLKLTKDTDGYWKIVAITNFKEFMAFVKENQKEQLRNYLTSTEALYNEYDGNTKANEEKLAGVLAAGTLGSDTTRGQIADLINQNVIPELKAFREKLAQVKTPSTAETLQNLRLQILDNKIAYYESYSNWLTTKNIENLRKATDHLNAYETMEEDSKNLLNRITMQLN